MKLNHTIVYCSDRATSSQFLCEILGLQPPTRYGPFNVVTLDNDVSLDYLQIDQPISEQHLAFLITEAEFDEVLERIESHGVSYWADPGRTRAGSINRNDSGRGVYFDDPDGHLLEVITVPYGG